MVLTGTFERSLDEKQRLAVPKRLREQMGGDEVRSLFVTPEPNLSIGLYSSTAFERLAARLEARSSNRAEYRNFLRLFYARAEELELDGQSRIRIPDRLMEYAQLHKEVVLMGVQDHAEIWGQARWAAFLEQHGPNFDAMASQAFA